MGVEKFRRPLLLAGDRRFTAEQLEGLAQQMFGATAGTMRSLMQSFLGHGQGYYTDSTYNGATRLDIAADVQTQIAIDGAGPDTVEELNGMPGWANNGFIPAAVGEGYHCRRVARCTARRGSRRHRVRPGPGSRGGAARGRSS